MLVANSAMFRANVKIKEDIPQTTLSNENQHDGVVRTRIVIYERIGPVCGNQDDRIQTNESESKISRADRSTKSNFANNVNVQVPQFLNENINDNNHSDGGNMYKVKQTTEKVKKDSHNYKRREETSTRLHTYQTKDKNTKYASIRSQLKLKNRFSNSNVDIPNMINTEETNERSKKVTSDYVKRMSRQFEQKIEENNKPVKKTLQRNSADCRNNTWKSKDDSNIKTFQSADNNNEGTNNKTDMIEMLRNNIVADISKSFQTGQYYENEINNTYNEEEFDKIESTFHEMESTILEMQAAHRLQQKEQRTQDNNRNSKFNTIEEDISSFRGSFKINRNENDEKDRDSLSEDNMYYVIIDESCQDRDEEFGKSNFESLEDINFVEAYNRRGSELILTQVGQILRRSISQDRRNSTLNFLHKKFPEETFDKENENEQFSQTISKTEYLPGEVKVHSGTEITNYFSGHDVIAINNNSKKSGSESTESEASSNRSTLYAVSEYNDDDILPSFDSGNIDVREKVVTFDQGIRRETYYNSQKNPVIEKICNLESCHMNHGESHYDIDCLGRERQKSKEKRKIDYLAEELLYSEEKYISDLEKIIMDYMPFLINEETIPHHLIAKAHIVFGNIKNIYNRTKDFYDDLKGCAEIPELIADTFLKHVNLFQMYPIYYKNKPTADYYLTKEFRSDIIARQKHLGDRLGLASYLLTPVQRLGKYILLLEQIQKELTQEGTPSNKIRRAIEMIRKQMSRGNDFLAIDSIKECPVNLTQQGSFIMREKFNIIKPRKFEAMLFLFEEIVVITSPDTRDLEKFIYRDSIRLVEMGIVTFENQPLVFHLKCFPSYNSPTKEHVEFVIEAKRKKDKKVWTEQIEKRLWEQLFKCKEENTKIHGTYKNKPKKLVVTESEESAARTEQGNNKNINTSATLPHSKKSAKKSVFYYTLENSRKIK